MSNQTIVVIGASGGIGSELCRRLRRDRKFIVLAGRNEPALQKLAEELDSPHLVVDATDIQAMDDALQATVEDFGAVDGVVNCVGSVLLKPAHLTSPSDWEKTISTNLTSAFAVVRAGAKVMLGCGGSIVLISSAAATVGLKNHEVVAAAKAGVEGLARSAAATYAARNVRVNAVSPGLVKTNLTKRIWSNEKTAQATCDMHALKRLGEPGDVASAICWLLQPENNWISGQSIGVDGGLSRLQA